MTVETPAGADRPGLAGLVLAAGGAKRFGGPKQLAKIGGVSLVRRAVALALDCAPAGVVVVTGGWAQEVEAELAGQTVQLCRNTAWQTGLSSSLHCGLDAMPARARACLVMLADQPLLEREDLRGLVAAWATAPHRVAAAAYAGVTGAPAVFPAAFWPRIRALGGDCGARSLLAALPDVIAVALPRAACDVDTPEDLAAATRA